VVTRYRDSIFRRHHTYDIISHNISQWEDVIYGARGWGFIPLSFLGHGCLQEGGKMHIAETGHIVCKCGNDELVFLQSKPPFEAGFNIHCHRCNTWGSIIARGETLKINVPVKRR